VAENGNYAFIKCPESRAIYGRDIFLHQKVVSVDKLRIGQRVKFKISLDFSGKPNADPCECIDTPDPLAGKEPGEGEDGDGKLVPFQQGKGMGCGMPMGGCMGNMGMMGGMGMGMGGMGMGMPMGGMGMMGNMKGMCGKGGMGADGDKPFAKSPQVVPPRGKGGDDPSAMEMPQGAEQGDASDLWSRFGMTRPSLGVDDGSASKRQRTDEM